MIYEVRRSGTQQQRQAIFEELGAKGYLYRPARTYLGEGRHDVFVKNSELATTYRYQFHDLKPFIPMANELGAQGYVYVEFSPELGYHIFGKDMKSDTMYDYVEADMLPFVAGALGQLNEMGSTSFAFVGNKRGDHKNVALYMRSSTYKGIYSYTTAPQVFTNAEDDIASLIEHGMRNEAFQGRYLSYDENWRISLFAKGPPITQAGGLLASPYP